MHQTLPRGLNVRVFGVDHIGSRRLLHWRCRAARNRRLIRIGMVLYEQTVPCHTARHRRMIQ